MHDCIDLPRHEDEMRDIVSDEGKPGVPADVRQVIRTASDEIIHPDDIVPFREQTVAQMRAKKTCRTSDENAHE
jgi:hypothetical protein